MTWTRKGEILDWDGIISAKEFRGLIGSAGSSASGFDIIVATDGSGDFTDIQSGLDAVVSGGGTVYVKAGTYTVTSGLTISRSSTRLILDGGATIQCNGATVPTLLTVSTTGLSRIEVRGGKWLQTNATAQGVCFDFSDTPNHWCGEMRIEEFATAIQIIDTTSTSFYSQWENVQIFNCNNGISMGGTQPNNNLFTNVRVRPKAGGNGKGVALVDTRGNTFLHCDFEPATGTGITGVHIDGSSRENMFLNCWIENNTSGAFIASGAVRNSFIGCSITSNTSDIENLGRSTLFLNTSKTGQTVNIQDTTNFTTASASAIYVLSTNDNSGSDDNLVRIETTDSNYSRPLLRIIDTSTAGGAASIRIDSPNPDIEFVEDDQVAPAGKFELAVQSDAFQINGRNDADNSFRVQTLFTRPGDSSGAVGIGFTTVTNPRILTAHLHVVNNIESASNAAGLIGFKVDGAIGQAVNLAEFGNVSGAVFASVSNIGAVSGAILHSSKGFTGNGTFTNFTISGGIITAAS